LKRPLVKFAYRFFTKLQKEDFILSETLIQTKETDSLKLAVLNGQLCQDKLAEDVLLIDLQEIESSPANYFVVASCESDAQVRAITDYIIRTARDYRLIHPKVEGVETGEWVILDYFDVVLHVMLKDVRTRYKIEKLWGDAKFFSINDDAETKEISLDSVLDIYQ